MARMIVSKSVCCLLAMISLIIVGASPIILGMNVAKYSASGVPATGLNPNSNIIKPSTYKNPAAPIMTPDSDAKTPASSPSDLESLCDISIFTSNLPPYNTNAQQPPPSGTGNPWKPSDNSNDITITVTMKSSSMSFNETTNAGVYFKCFYWMWDGTSSFYKVRMTPQTQQQDVIVLGSSDDTRFLVVGGTQVQWFINATSDQFPKTAAGNAHISQKYLYTVGGIWPSHDFDTNAYFNVSTNNPILGDPVTVTVDAKKTVVMTGPTVYYPNAKIRDAILSVNISYPDGTTDFFTTSMYPNGTESGALGDRKSFTISGDYNQKPGTVVYLSVMIITYAGYGWFYTLSSAVNEVQYTVSNIGNFPVPATFEKTCQLTANPDVITNRTCAPNTPVNITITSYPDSQNNPVPIYAQIFFFINITDQQPLSGIDSMTKISANHRYYNLPGVTPTYAESTVTFWVHAIDNAGTTVRSKHFEYTIPKLSQPAASTDKAIFIVAAYDDYQGIGIAGAPVSITGVDYSLDDVTNSMGTLIPHEASSASIIHFLTINNSYVVNVTYPLIHQAHDITYILDANPIIGTKILAGRGYKGNTKLNWSIQLVVDKDKMRTLKFIFNIYEAPPLIFADIAVFPNFIVEYMTYVVGIILLIPMVIILDKRRKKAEEEEKRVTL